MRLSLILFILALVTGQEQPQYSLITDYGQYLAAWKQMVPSTLIHDATNFVKSSDLCSNGPCKHYFYESVDPSLQADQKTSRTLLLISGFHGNELLGPNVLLNAYPVLKAARILYFPLANPSGFIDKIALTAKQQIDPAFDFPVSANSDCYQTASTQILDYIYRHYSIDMAITIYSKSEPKIGYVWGTEVRSKDAYTDETQIFKDLGEMLKFYGGENAMYKIPSFKVGTIFSEFGDSPASFEDWAYGANRFVEVFSADCNKFKVEPYPESMFNGLAMRLDIGPDSQKSLGSKDGIDNIDPIDMSSRNGRISRVIRMLNSMSNVMHPSLILKVQNQQFSIRALGCKLVVITRFDMYRLITREGKKEKELVLSKAEQIKLAGTITAGEIEDYKLEIPASVQLSVGDELNIFVNFNCDPAWRKRGSTVFAQKREYSQYISVLNQPKSVSVSRPKEISPQSMKDKSASQTGGDLSETMVLLIIAATALALMLIILILRRKKQLKGFKKPQKFQDVEFMEERDDVWGPAKETDIKL